MFVGLERRGGGGGGVQGGDAYLGIMHPSRMTGAPCQFRKLCAGCKRLGPLGASRSPGGSS